MGERLHDLVLDAQCVTIKACVATTDLIRSPCFRELLSSARQELEPVVLDTKSMMLRLYTPWKPKTFGVAR